MSFRISVPFVLPLALALLCAVTPASGQSLFGTILGTVMDKSEAVVPRASVRIRNLDTNAVRLVLTDQSGDYQAPALPVGDYQITCEAAGFKRVVVPRVTLTVDQRERVDLRLEVGAVEQQVEIDARAPIVETDTASQGTVIDNRRIVELPLNGRNFEQLAVLAPGVIAPVAGAGNTAYFSVAGTRGLSNSFMMDGATNTNNNANVTFINPSIDLIEEFKILRNTFNAEFGHGAAQINVVTKSGGNNIHLTLFEFLRNDDIEARNFFDPSRKPPLRRNQFGGTGSGPVLVPKLYNGKNRTFWLFNYEGVRQNSPSTLLSTIPTQSELGGDLSALLPPLASVFLAANPPKSAMLEDQTRLGDSVATLLRRVLEGFGLIWFTRFWRVRAEKREPAHAIQLGSLRHCDLGGEAATKGCERRLRQGYRRKIPRSA